MEIREIDQLITKLEGLRLQRQQLDAQEQATIQQIKTLTQVNTPHRDSPSVSSGILFSPGDKVLITNKIKQVRNRKTEPKDRAGTVRFVQNSRVYITTCNHVKTWRAPTNLRLLHEEDYQNILRSNPTDKPNA